MSDLLDRINSPADLKALATDDLDRLAAEVRQEMVKVVTANGGHLASSLGVVELTIALHRVFDSPCDKIVWDVGHQSYPHKLLTGRRTRFATLRQYGGLSGFPAPWESPHDAFVAGHAGNSISAALGMVVGGRLKGANFHVVAVIGDGSLGSGMAFEAINHAGHLGRKIIVVLNDNGMSISPSIGALAHLLNRVKLDSRYATAKRKARTALDHMPYGESAWTFSKKVKERMERVVLPNAFWEQLGFSYLGPLDGHNIRELESVLMRARDQESGPVLIHVMTQKGKGLPEAESDAVKYHGLSPQVSSSPKGQSYSQIFSQTVTSLMRRHPNIVLISAAMLDGVGLAQAAQEFPDRVFDVGICEQHAVTLAAGLATQGLTPIVAIYSTFLQRAYDQIMHDICLPGLPVILAVDRAGIVGEDGKTHQGPFDISYLSCLPNMSLASPADENELQNLIYSAINYRRPLAIRYPRGTVPGVGLSPELLELPYGKGEVLREGKDLSLIALGPLAYEALKAAETLSEEGVDCAVINARFVKPLDCALILAEAERTGRLLTIEENVVRGGFGSSILELLSSQDVFGVKLKCLGLPDSFIEHGPQQLFRTLYNLDADGIARTVRNGFGELFQSQTIRSQEES